MKHNGRMPETCLSCGSCELLPSNWRQDRTYVCTIDTEGDRTTAPEVDASKYCPRHWRRLPFSEPHKMLDDEIIPVWLL